MLLPPRRFLTNWYVMLHNAVIDTRVSQYMYTLCLARTPPTTVFSSNPGQTRQKFRNLKVAAPVLQTSGQHSQIPTATCLPAATCLSHGLSKNTSVFAIPATVPTDET